MGGGFAGSRGEDRFIDRTEAGKQLAQALRSYRGQDCLVLGLPRGGVPLAYEVALVLDAELDVVVARKLGAPGQPELAIGAVSANGGRYLNANVIRELDVEEDYLERVTAREREEAAAREHRFRDGRPQPAVEGRTVIIVDDGLATGATMFAAVRSVRARNPARLIAAVPVAPVETARQLEREVDELVVLATPEPFWAVGLHYLRFDPVPDEAVQDLLRRASQRPGMTASGRSDPA